MTERDYSLCIDCRHQRGTWISDREVERMTEKCEDYTMEECE